MSNGSHSKRMLLVTVAAALLVVGAACGGDDDGGGETLTAVGGKVTLVAEGNEWNADRIEVPAGEEVTITVDNQDDGVSHNLHVKDGVDAKTDLEKGPVEQTLKLEVDAGDYEYVCDVHSNMEGTLVAEEAPADTSDTTG